MKNLQELFIWPEQKPQINPETNHWCLDENGYMIKYLISLIKPKYICELGSWTGTGSTKYIMEASSDSHLLCFDHWSADVNDHGNSGTTVYADNDPELKQLPKIWDSFLYNCWEYKNRITPVRAKTLIGLESIKEYNVPVDLIYIDADHSYQGAYNDIMKCAEIWPNAQICGDDYSWKEVKAAVKDAAHKLNKRVLFSNNCWWFTTEIAFGVNF